MTCRISTLSSRLRYYIGTVKSVSSKYIAIYHKSIIDALIVCRINLEASELY